MVFPDHSHLLFLVHEMGFRQRISSNIKKFSELIWPYGILANSEYPDDMPHSAAFPQGPHCLLSQNLSSETEFGNYNT